MTLDRVASDSIPSRNNTEVRSELPSSKRLLILITTLAVGGAEAQAIALAINFKQRNWQVTIVCLVGPLTDVSHIVPQGIDIHSLNMKAGIPDVRAIFRLRRLIKRLRPQIVHCHMFHANLLGRATRLFCHIPTLICTAHNIKETSRRGGPTWHKELLYRVTDRLSDVTTIISKAAFDRYVAIRAVPRDRLRLIPNGVDTDLFSHSEELRERTRIALGIDSAFVWLAVGRLVAQKDYPTLFEALSALKTKPFVVLIAGAGPLEGQLREQCTRLDLNSHVRFCGSLGNLLHLYNAADAFVMASQFEGMSVALLEAASMRLPAVVTRVGGNPEIVLDDVTGYLVPPQTPSRLAEAMERMMMASTGRRDAMGHAARKHCQQHFGLAEIIDKWIELYTKCARDSSLRAGINRCPNREC